MGRMGPGHYFRVLRAVASMTVRQHLRRKRTWIMGGLILLPVLLPPLIAYYEPAGGPPPLKLIVAVSDFLYVFTLVPLTALFYAGSLLSEEIEGQTFPLLVSRPAPRSALVLGKYVAYAVVSTLLVTISLVAMFYSAGLFLKLPLGGAQHALLARYGALCALGLMAYGALCLLVSTLTRRPVIVSALFIFGWEKLVIALPGYADFLTVQKYLGRLLPPVEFRRVEIAKVELPVELMREVYPVGTGAALVVLACLTAVFLIAACWAVRVRQFTAAVEAG